MTDIFPGTIDVPRTNLKAFAPILTQERFSGLRAGLTLKARQLRYPRILSQDLSQPFAASEFDINVGGVFYKRKKITLATMGCSTDTCTMCPIPNERLEDDSKVDASNYVEQFHNSFGKNESLDHYQMVSVFVSGNWFADTEIAPEVRREIYKAIANSKCEALMVESLPQFINSEKIREAQEHLDGKRLVVAIGLQSANDFVRNVCINTSCTIEGFERATSLLREVDYEPRVYLMIKPPFLNELEAIYDTVTSIQYVKSQGYGDVSICPTRVAPGTIVEALYKNGRYTPPSLWTAVNIINAAPKDIAIRVSCLDLNDKDDDTSYPCTCAQCTDTVIDALIEFNQEQDRTILDSLDCACQVDLKYDRDDQPLDERVSDWISLQTN